MTEKRKVGRPTDYRPEYCEQVIATMREGLSLTAFAGGIGVARSTINKWIEDYPEFSEAVNIGKASVAAWYNLQAKRIVEEGGTSAQSTLIVFGLKNMDSESWRDKQEVQHSGSIEVSTKEQRDAAVAAAMAADK